MKTVIYRPSVEGAKSWGTQELEECFKNMTLVDKTVCEDRIVYVFTDNK